MDAGSGGIEDDELNDETFGSACAIDAGLPSFFQNTKGTTVLDALGDLSLECGDDDTFGDYSFPPSLKDDELFDTLQSPGFPQVSLDLFHTPSGGQFDDWKPSSLMSGTPVTPSFFNSPLRPTPSPRTTSRLVSGPGLFPDPSPDPSSVPLPAGARIMSPSELSMPIMTMGEMEKMLLGGEREREREREREAGSSSDDVR